VALAQHLLGDARRQHHAGGVVAAEALGVDEADVQVVAAGVTVGQADVGLVHVVGEGLDGLDAAAGRT
jgi:hypothetical protein